MAYPEIDSKTEQEMENLCSSPDYQVEIGKDTGLLKRVIRRGVTWQTPFLGDEVEVHFSGGRVKDDDGSCFDSSRLERDSPLRFKLGQREVISGLDQGIATMKKGEIAVFTVPPSLAYGENGFPPLIPPNATLTFQVELLSWTPIRDLTGDGGVMKKIVREGEGWATPKDGDQVTVQYEASLHQSHSSDHLRIPKSQGQDCVEFNVGNGGLCPAIHKAVKTMRRGEKAELTVKFSYGFGEEDADRTTGGFPLSTTSIVVELLSWRSVVDVVGDRKILKMITKAGEGFDRPADGSLVKVVYVGKLEKDGSIFDQKGSDGMPFEYTCLDEQVNEGLDRAIMSMRRGEKALVTISHDYQCNSSNGATMPSSRLIYEVELVNFTKEKPIWKMDAQEKIEMCERKKQEGNALFRAGKIWQASKKYEKAVKCVEFNHSFNEEDNRVADDLRASCYLNTAACKLKLGEYHEASKLCSKVLEQDPTNVKALYRRFLAYMKTSELEKAEVDIKRALAIDPHNRDIKVELKLLKEKQKEHSLNQAKLLTAMFSGTTTHVV